MNFDEVVRRLTERIINMSHEERVAEFGQVWADKIAAGIAADEAAAATVPIEPRRRYAGVIRSETLDDAKALQREVNRLNSQFADTATNQKTT